MSLFREGLFRHNIKENSSFFVNLSKKINHKAALFLAPGDSKFFHSGSSLEAVIMTGLFEMGPANTGMGCAGRYMKNRN